MPAPKISVLVPVFNGEAFLAEALDSILAQDFSDYEILVSDDCSTDGTAGIIEAFAAREPRIRWWRNPVNLGLTQNHNACLREARGDYIKFIHADDLLLQPAALRRMAQVLDEDATVSLVASGAQIIDAESRVLRVQNSLPKTGVCDGLAVLVQCLEQNGNIIGEPTRTLFRSRQARRGFDERYRQTCDLEMWFHLLEQGRFAYLAEPLFAYRIHPQQQTAQDRRTRASVDEHLWLAQTYFTRPWLAEHATRRMWFKQIYQLRKRYGPRAAGLTTEMLARLNRFWFALFWLEHKISRPLEKITRLIRLCT